jgi:hypothetical protein
MRFFQFFESFESAMPTTSDSRVSVQVLNCPIQILGFGATAIEPEGSTTGEKQTLICNAALFARPVNFLERVNYLDPLIPARAGIFGQPLEHLIRFREGRRTA